MTNHDYRDQRVGLIIFGSLAILAACLCGLLCLASVAMAVRGTGDVARTTPATFAQVIGFYGGMVVALIWLGVGSIMCRKWAAALILAVGWLWLIGGAIGLMVLLGMHDLFDRAMMQAFKDAGQMPPSGVIMTTKIVAFLFVSVIYLIIPAAVVFFYSRRSTRLTCASRDPRPRWTDGIPIPALMAAALLALSAYGVILSVATPAWPLFTILLKGALARIAILAQGTLLALAAWGAFRLKPWSWWLGWLVPLFMMLSFAVFMCTAGMNSYLEIFGADPSQRKALETLPLAEPRSWLWLFIAYPVVFTAFMLWVKRHFTGAPRIADAPMA